MKPAPRLRARLLILNYIAAFATSRYSEGSDLPFGSPDWSFTYRHPTSRIEIGSLVALQSAPFTKWYLSWLVEKIPGAESYEDTYVLESIEDGALCNWRNVGLIEFSRETTAKHPEWRWNDREHEFNDRWRRACYRGRSAYMYLPVQAEFIAGTHGVILGTRTRHCFNDARPRRQFNDWRKVTRKMMLAFYDDAVKEAKQADDRPRA